ncbi:F0F1 ATP synthase subunit A [Frigoriglobus tundricola]|uniref:ATP synthase subunit a n=1 Tax=Frigoriglobus tundricola TaxID=2774151 RepID=A0A6M5YIC8_9BACT|nr:F0F1 ATP synthase subunit A [Frigoriglobus tundricola]QJW93071.1 ATP synthase F0 sector subunit a [Frigoriglobus tundricola]
MALDPLEHVLDHAWVGPITKHQILLVVAAAALSIPYILLARRVKDGEPPRGPFWNFLEMLLLFIRDEVARANIHGGHDDHDHDEPAGISAALTSPPHVQGPPADRPHAHYADRYVPFLWTLFLFILVCNLLGMVPFLGSPTAEFSVTLVFAVMVFLVIHVSSIRKLGLLKYVKSYIPSLQADNVVMTVFLTVLIVPLITVIEVMGAFIRAGVLAIRLFANIFAGHVALGVIMLFAVADLNAGGVSPGGFAAAVVLGTGLSLLELLVAFLQAFVFVLLTSIFLGMQLNPEH